MKKQLVCVALNNYLGQLDKNGPTELQDGVKTHMDKTNYAEGIANNWF